MGAEPAVAEGPALRGLQGRPVLPEGRHGALEPRGQPGLPGRRGPERLHPLPDQQAARRAARGRRAARVDDDALDARLQRRRGRGPRAHLRAHEQRRGARRGARHPRDRRGRDRRGPLQGRGHGRRRLRAAVPVHPGLRVRREGPHRAARGLRVRRGRHRHRAHRDRVRRGRLPPRRRAGPRGHQPRARRRHLRRAHRPVRRPLRQGSRRRPDRGPARPRPPVPGRAPAARVPALLALRHAAALLRQAVLVHQDLAAPGPPARGQRERRLAPGAHQARPHGPLAGEQRGLGALPRALLGHAAPGLAQRGRRDRLHRLVRRAGGAVGRQARGPAPPVRGRRGDPVADRRGAAQARPRGDRRLVRQRQHAVRPVARAVREPGRLRATSSRRTTSARASTRRAAGSTRCWRSARCCSTRARTRPV